MTCAPADLRPRATTKLSGRWTTGVPSSEPRTESRPFCLGAFMAWRTGDEDKLYRVNCKGTRLLFGAAVSAGVRRFVFASSGEVYPENNPVNLPIAEDHPLNPPSHYGVTKLVGEELAPYHERTGKLETVILRFSHAQDASELLDEESFFSGPRFFYGRRIQQQEKLGNRAAAELLRQTDPGVPAHILSKNENGRPFRMRITDARDIVAGIVLALEASSAAGETYNLGATEPVDFCTRCLKLPAIRLSRSISRDREYII